MAWYDSISISISNNKRKFQGLDIPDITLAVQFGVPMSLSVWLQRAGRAGRSPHVQARAILLVESSALQRVGSTATVVIVDGENSVAELEDENIAYRSGRLSPTLSMQDRTVKTLSAMLPTSAHLSRRVHSI